MKTWWNGQGKTKIKIWKNPGEHAVPSQVFTAPSYAGHSRFAQPLATACPWYRRGSRSWGIAPERSIHTGQWHTGTQGTGRGSLSWGRTGQCVQSPWQTEPVKTRQIRQSSQTITLLLQYFLTAWNVISCQSGHTSWIVVMYFFHHRYFW